MTRREWPAEWCRRRRSRGVSRRTGPSASRRSSACTKAGHPSDRHRGRSASAEWLAGEVRDAGLTPTLEPFALARVDPIAAALTSAGARFQACRCSTPAFTGAAGIDGPSRTARRGQSSSGLAECAHRTLPGPARWATRVVTPTTGRSSVSRAAAARAVSEQRGRVRGHSVRRCCRCRAKRAAFLEESARAGRRGSRWSRRSSGSAVEALNVTCAAGRRDRSRFRRWSS